MSQAWVVAAVLSLGASVASTDENPAGTWKWSVERNGQKFESVLKLKLEGDKLTGTISGRDGKDSPIEEASWKDGEVKFSVTRERNGEKMVTKYSGKVVGDAVVGKAETGERSREWKAERAKE